jgi:hypothetical protein
MWATTAKVVHTSVVVITICTWISAIVRIAIRSDCDLCEKVKDPERQHGPTNETLCSQIIRVPTNGSLNIHVCNINGCIVVQIQKNTGDERLTLNVKYWIAFSRKRFAIGHGISRLRHSRDKELSRGRKV